LPMALRSNFDAGIVRSDCNDTKLSNTIIEATRMTQSLSIGRREIPRNGSPAPKRIPVPEVYSPHLLVMSVLLCGQVLEASSIWVHRNARTVEGGPVREGVLGSWNMWRGRNRQSRLWCARVMRERRVCPMRVNRRRCTGVM
jgi:hypothetical protein